MMTLLREGVKIGPFSRPLLLGIPATPQPPSIGPWVIKILGPCLNVAVDAIGPETNKKSGRKTTEHYLQP